MANCANSGGKWCRPNKRLGIYLRDNFQCVYCGSDLRAAQPCNVTLDHIVPQSQGGSNDPSNLVTACKRCNSSRGVRAISDFAPGGSQDRIAALVAKDFAPYRKLATSIIAGTAGDPRVEVK